MLKQNFIVFISISFCLLNSCTKTHVVDKPIKVEIPISNTYQYLPENLIAKDSLKQVTARYTDPTPRYAHGILGDQIEGGGLLVTVKGKEYHYKLDENNVFEDLQPRLADVDNDGNLEFITIQSSTTGGGSVAVYKIIDDKLQPYLTSGYIGTPSRWLNVAAIGDLDNDGKIEIAWIQTPHIGGILKIARVENNQLVLLDSKSGITNHRIGSKNLCLSVLTNTSPQKTLYIPTQQYDAIKGFQLINSKIVEVETINQAVNDAISLFQQYNFKDKIEDRNCINP